MPSSSGKSLNTLGLGDGAPSAPTYGDEPLLAHGEEGLLRPGGTPVLLLGIHPRGSIRSPEAGPCSCSLPLDIYNTQSSLPTGYGSQKQGPWPCPGVGTRVPKDCHSRAQKAHQCLELEQPPPRKPGRVTPGVRCRQVPIG